MITYETFSIAFCKNYCYTVDEISRLRLKRDASINNKKRLKIPQTCFRLVKFSKLFNIHPDTSKLGKRESPSENWLT